MTETKRKILALDLATKCGWAMRDGYGGAITSGTVEFRRDRGTKKRPAEHNGEQYNRFFRWLKQTIVENGITEIVVEAPIQFTKGMAARDKAIGMRTIVEMLAAAYSLPDVKDYVNSTIKKWATGSGKAEKPHMIAAAIRLGCNHTADDNEADAYLLLRMHCELSYAEAVRETESDFHQSDETLFG